MYHLWYTKEVMWNRLTQETGSESRQSSSERKPEVSRCVIG